MGFVLVTLSSCLTVACGGGIGQRTATNANQSSASPSSSVQPLAIETAGLPGGSIGAGYTSELTAAGGSAPYKWSILSGSLPAGIGLNAQTGAIEGVPSQAGTFNAEFQVADSSDNPETSSRNLAFEIANANSPATSPQQPAFYGSGINADELGNLPVGTKYGYQVSYRFRAEHSGALGDVHFYLITDGPHPGYNAGTGGTLLIQLESDDGTEAHNPSGQVMGSYTITHPSQAFTVINFSPVPSLKAGDLYHLVFSNTDLDQADNFVSVDDLYTNAAPDPAQPTLSNTNFAALQKTPGGQWYQLAQFTPILEFDYSDGSSQGCGYVEAWPETPEPIGGTPAVREQFTVSGSNLAAKQVAIRVARMSGSGDLTVVLQQADGTIIEQGTIAASSMPVSSSATNPTYTWATYNFSAVRTLFSGQAYDLVLQAADGSTYQAFPIRKGSSEDYSNGTFFPDGYAQFTRNGSSWSGWDQWGVTNRQDGDLQFYFTVVP